MIKKILVALDPDSDTPVATRFAIDIAKRHQAEVTGVAVVDMGSIESSIRGGGIGSMYFADQLKEKLTTETRAKAQALIAEFHDLVRDSGVPFSELLQEGVPFKRIVEDMKVHDMLIVGSEPHFFYSHPKQATETLARIVRLTVGPTLIVGSELRPINRVLVAYDGSATAARALRSFIRTQPFGNDVKLQLLQIYDGSSTEADLQLDLTAAYLQAHGFAVEKAAVKSNDKDKAIVDQIGRFGADLVVAGAHSKSKFRAFAFGSTTTHLVDNCPVPLFLDS